MTVDVATDIERQRPDAYMATARSGDETSSTLIVAASEWVGPVLSGEWTATMSAGVVVYASAGTQHLGDVMIGRGASLFVGSGVTLANLLIEPPQSLTSAYAGSVYIRVESGAKVTDTHFSDAKIWVEGGGESVRNSYSDTDLRIMSGGASVSDRFGSVNSAESTFDADGGALISDFWQGSGTVAHLYPGVCADGVRVASGASMQIQIDVSLSDVTVEAGALIECASPFGREIIIPTKPAPGSGEVLENGVELQAVRAEDGRTYYTDGEYIWWDLPYAPDAGCSLTITSGAVVSGVVAERIHITVQDGGSLSGSYLSNAYVVVESGGVVGSNVYDTCVVVLHGGARSLNDIAFAPDGQMGFVEANGGAYVENPSIGNGALLVAYANAFITDPAVAEGGMINVRDAKYDPCFLAGAIIDTEQGGVPVEDLKPGMKIVCLVAGNRVLRDIADIFSCGSRVVPGFVDDLAGYPVCVEAGALGDGLPSRDLLVTAEHCFLFSGQFVPVRMLVNGRSIRYESSVTSYRYYHIELEQHGIIFANDVPTESYLDTGGRARFRARGARGNRARVRTWHADAAAPLNVSREFVEPIFARLALRAGVMAPVGGGWSEGARLTRDPQIHLRDQSGRRYEPVHYDTRHATFELPRGLKSVRLVSRMSRPCDVIGPFVDDRRWLGVLVGRITTCRSGSVGEFTRHLEVESCSGWHDREQEAMRWTKGAALIEFGDDGHGGPMTLTIECIAGGPYLDNAEKPRALVA